MKKTHFIIWVTILSLFFLVAFTMLMVTLFSSTCSKTFIKLFGNTRGQCLYRASKAYMDPDRFSELCTIVQECSDVLNNENKDESQRLACLQPHLRWDKSERDRWEKEILQVLQACPPPNPKTPIITICGAAHPVLCLFRDQK